MGAWINKYTKEMIGSETTIQNQNPGKLIAGVLTEIQERVPNEVQVEGDSGITAKLKNNVLIIGGEGFGKNVEISITANENTSIDGINATVSKEESDDVIEFEIVIEYGQFLPSGGIEYEVLQRNAAGDAVWGPVRALDE